MPTFKDSNGIPPLLPPGDYVFCVVDFEIGISSGGKTRGADKFDMTLEIEPNGNKVNEVLIDHDLCDWKIDTFLKSSGIKLAKGQAFQFREDTAKEQGVPWVNPIGLRGWCRVKQETMPKTEQYPNPRTVNKVDVFYVDKEKLARRVIEVAEEDAPF